MNTQLPITRYLEDARNGDSEAFNEVFQLVYNELRNIAHRHLHYNGRSDTLDTGALVHEAYEHLVGNAEINWQDRNHFFALASRVMRHILIDYVRNRSAKKRGYGLQKLPLNTNQLAIEECTSQLEALEEALRQLFTYNENLAKLVELKFYGGLTHKQISEIMGTSERTVRRDWQRARTWIYTAMQ